MHLLQKTKEVKMHLSFQFYKLIIIIIIINLSCLLSFSKPLYQAIISFKLRSSVNGTSGLSSCVCTSSTDAFPHSHRHSFNNTDGPLSRQNASVQQKLRQGIQNVPLPIPFISALYKGRSINILKTNVYRRSEGGRKGRL